jgi:hypothetical protein
MYNAGRYEDMRDSRRALTRFVRDRFRAGLRVGFAVGFAVVLTSGCMRTDRAPTTAPAPVGALDVSPFVLNAFLVPALDSDALPLRWTDPRPPSSCGSATTVTVNGEPLVAGALVPDQPFELEWDAEDCHPFGAQGPTFQGRVKLSVYREDWGFSATVEPSGLRVTSVDGATTSLRSDGVSLFVSRR